MYSSSSPMYTGHQAREKATCLNLRKAYSSGLSSRERMRATAHLWRGHPVLLTPLWALEHGGPRYGSPTLSLASVIARMDPDLVREPPAHTGAAPGRVDRLPPSFVVGIVGDGPSRVTRMAGRADLSPNSLDAYRVDSSIGWCRCENGALARFLHPGIHASLIGLQIWSSPQCTHTNWLPQQRF